MAVREEVRFKKGGGDMALASTASALLPGLRQLRLMCRIAMRLSVNPADTAFVGLLTLATPKPRADFGTPCIGREVPWPLGGTIVIDGQRAAASNAECKGRACDGS